MTGEGRFEQYYSVIPLYAFKTSRAVTSGTSTSLTPRSRWLRPGCTLVSSTRCCRMAGPRFHLGYFLTGYTVDISLVDDKGNRVPVRFNQVPSPLRTINSQTYTSGAQLVFEAGLSGGAAGAGLSLSSGCNFSSSRSVRSGTCPSSTTRLKRKHPLQTGGEEPAGVGQHSASGHIQSHF